MTITEYCDILNLSITIKYYQRQGVRWTASIDDAEIKTEKEPGILQGLYGDGATPDAAVSSYIEKIKGHTLVFKACDAANRREYLVPKNLVLSLVMF